MKKLFVIGGGCLLLSVLLLPYWHGKSKAPFRLHRIAIDRAGGGDGTLSPDGQRFVTSSRRTGNWDIWIYDLRSTLWTQVTQDPADDFEAKWSPDSSTLVFCSTRTGQKDIWTVDLKTGALKQLTFSEHDDEYPAWSPDGKDIVYTGGPWGNEISGLLPPLVERRERSAGSRVPPAPALTSRAAKHSSVIATISVREIFFGCEWRTEKSLR